MNTKQSKAWYKRFWVWVLIIIVLIGVGGAMGGGDTPTTTNTNDSGSDAKTEEKEEKTEFKVGEAVSFDDKTITVTKVQRNYDTGNEFAQPESGKEFVIVTVKITNNGEAALDYNTFEFKMQDSDGVQLDEDFAALTEGKLNSGSLAKGGKVTGKLAYQVPKGDKGLKLLYQNLSFFDNKTITFNLK